MSGLGDLSGGEIKSIGHGISDDGTVIIGADVPDDQAFRWEDGVMIGLDDPPGGAAGSRALSISSDKSVIVGWASGEAVVWRDGLIAALGSYLGSMASA